jgi:hypothetical protein
VPLELSHYIVENTVRQATVGYHGTFDVDSRSADLIEMTVLPTDLSKALAAACDIRIRMTYTRTAMQAGEFTIPETTEKEYLAKDGSFFVNRLSYEGCRQYTSESVLTFGNDAPATLPTSRAKISLALPVAGSELRLRLVSKIDSQVGSAGDSLEATLEHAVRDAEGGTIPAGTVIPGHLAQLERVHFPQRRVVIAIRFDTLVLNGALVRLLWSRLVGWTGAGAPASVSRARNWSLARSSYLNGGSARRHLKRY